MSDDPRYAYKELGEDEFPISKYFHVGKIGQGAFASVHRCVKPTHTLLRWYRKDHIRRFDLKPGEGEDLPPSVAVKKIPVGGRDRETGVYF